MIDVKASDLQMIKRILNQYVPASEIRVFGSRVTGQAKTYSDLDIAIVGKEKISNKTKAELKYAFEESDLPFRVDIIDWNSISDEFKAIIEQRYEVL